MKNLFCIALTLSLLTQYGQINKALDEVEQINYDEAQEICDANIKSGVDVVSSSLLKVMLLNMSDDLSSFNAMKTGLAASENPDPYIYAMWFTNAGAGGYGKQSKEKFAYLNNLRSDESHNATIQGSANYALGHHYARINDFKTAKESWKKLNALTEWQFAGVFDNTLE